jgi:hypothetical protein
MDEQYWCITYIYGRVDEYITECIDQHPIDWLKEHNKGKSGIFIKHIIYSVPITKKQHDGFLEG